MYCKNCGTQLQDDVNFCSKCGVQFPKGLVDNSDQTSSEITTSQKWEYVNKVHKNKNSMLDNLIQMKREGWTPIQCTKMTRKFPPSLYSIFVGEVYYINYERGIPLTPKEKKDQESLYKPARWPGNLVSKLEEWEMERKRKNQ
jgi:hypothetical protein